MRPTKRDELVQKALHAFYQNGFHATGTVVDVTIREVDGGLLR